MCCRPAWWAACLCLSLAAGWGGLAVQFADRVQVGLASQVAFQRRTLLVEGIDTQDVIVHKAQVCQRRVVIGQQGDTGGLCTDWNPATALVMFLASAYRGGTHAPLASGSQGHADFVGLASAALWRAGQGTQKGLGFGQFGNAAIGLGGGLFGAGRRNGVQTFLVAKTDRKSTRLNSSHVKISYAVFCLKKK